MFNQHNTKPIIEVPSQPQPLIHFTVNTDVILIIGFLIYALWDKLMKSKVANKLDGVFAPIEEERRLTNIIAQIGIITKASRVVLAVFHNGSLDSQGYHLQKISTVNTYTAPGYLPMNYPVRDLPIGRIMFEIEEMMKCKDWFCVTYNESLPQPCKDHLLKNDMHKMCNRLVKVGNLPIGILSLQYSKTNPSVSSPIIEEQHEIIMNELYSEISGIMRRRVIHPSPIKKVFKTLLNILKFKK